VDRIAGPDVPVHYEKVFDAGDGERLLKRRCGR
jgi:hypothetical protein